MNAKFKSRSITIAISMIVLGHLLFAGAWIVWTEYRQRDKNVDFEVFTVTMRNDDAQAISSIATR